jgi:CheY-like chemotaxis protein
MPVLDGISATKQIREAERGRSAFHATTPRSHARNNNRVPIFAVSASLPETRLEEIQIAEFDGWMVKPIDFRRVNEIIGGIWDYQQRRRNLYSPSTKKNWERGGWLVPPPE